MAKFTKSFIDKIPLSDKQQVYWDSGLPGFGLVVGQKAKTFIVQRDVRGKARRKKVGRYSQAFTLEKAKAQAKDWLGDLTVGVIPWEVAAAKAAQSITLEQAFEKFIDEKVNKAKLSPVSITNYKQAIKYLSKWNKKELSSITYNMVSDRHTQIGNENGPYQANLTIRTFRAVYNHAQKGRELPPNPVVGLTFYKDDDDPESKRSKPIPTEILPVFWRLLDEKISSTMRRDYYKLLLFTGLRKTSALSIEKDHIDLKEKTLHIPLPKGGRSRAFTLPLSDYLCVLIKGLLENNNSDWLFPSNRGKTGHMSDPKERKFVKALEEETGYHLTVHGLRHTFISQAESMAIGTYQTKLLVNHALPKSDITARYTKLDVDDLREPMQRITTRLLSLVEPKQEKKVVEMKR